MWQHIWDLHLSVGEKVLRSILIYAFLVVALRVVGKKFAETLAILLDECGDFGKIGEFGLLHAINDQ